MSLKCDEGYTLVGNSTLTCGEQGIWSVSTASCLKGLYSEWCVNFM